MILGACPDAGTAPFEVRSEAHAAALRRYAMSTSPTGRWFWANFFAGPRVDCPTLANRGGWLRAPTDWVDANVAPAALLPLTMNENCNNMNQFDPIPINNREGYHNRHCMGCGVLLNRTEGDYPGTVVCSVNDVPACATGTDDCNGLATDGCEVDLRTDAMHCGRCRNACSGGMVCEAGVCRSLSAASCAELHRNSPSLPSGVYRIDLDGAGPARTPRPLLRHDDRRRRLDARGSHPG